MTACSTWGESDYSPAISVSHFFHHPIDTAADMDTLRVISIPNGLDTIKLGDTVRFNVNINAVTSTLVSFQLSKCDTSALDFSLTNLTSDFRSALADSSSIEDCKLYFKEGYVGAGFGLQYIATKVGVHEVTMEVKSTSKYEKSYLTFTQPVF